MPRRSGTIGCGLTITPRRRHVSRMTAACAPGFSAASRACAACAHGAGGDSEMTASRRHPARTGWTASAPRAGGRNAVPRAPSLALFCFPSGRVGRSLVPRFPPPTPLSRIIYVIRNAPSLVPRSVAPLRFPYYSTLYGIKKDSCRCVIPSSHCVLSRAAALRKRLAALHFFRNIGRPTPRRHNRQGASRRQQPACQRQRRRPAHRRRRNLKLSAGASPHGRSHAAAAAPIPPHSCAPA